MRMSFETKCELIENFGKKKSENLLPVTTGKKIVKIMKKAPSKRSIEEVEEIMNIIRYVKFFKNKTNQLKDIAMGFCFQRSQPDEEIIRYGEYGDKFYIILQGKVSVEIPNPAIRSWKDFYAQY